MEKLFKKYKVDVEILEENQSMITATNSDRPVGWLLKADLHEKMDFARVLHRNYVKMINIVQKET